MKSILAGIRLESWPPAGASKFTRRVAERDARTEISERVHGIGHAVVMQVHALAMYTTPTCIENREGEDEERALLY